MEEEKKKTTWEELFKKPDIFNLIIKEFDKKVVGEEIPKKVLFLCFCGIYVKNSFKPSYNLIINSKSGSGKDHITNSILEIFPEKRYKTFTKITPQALSYYKKDDPNFTWEGIILYCEDITQQTLDSPVLKVLSSNQSSTLSFLKDKTLEIRIKGKPIIVMTFANNILGIEYIRRFETCQLNELQDHSKAIIKRQAEMMANGINPQYDPTITIGLNNLKPIEIIIPFAEKIAPHFPSDDLIIRTKFNRFGDYIRSSCAIHQLQRKTNEKNKYIAEPQDYEIAREVFNYLNKFKKLIPLTNHQQKIIEYFKELNNNTIKLTPTSIHNKLNQFITLKALIENLQALTGYEFLDVSTETDDYNRERTKFSYNPNNFNELENFKLPSFDKL